MENKKDKIGFKFQVSGLRNTNFQYKLNYL